MMVLSYVFWKNKYYEKKRIEWFCENVLLTNPDIILLHNVSNDIISTLLRAFEKYDCKVSDSTKPYYEMICTSPNQGPIKSFKYSKYSNCLQDGLFWVELDNGTRLIVSTLNIDPQKRDNQLKCSFKFIGDSNFVYSCYALPRKESLPPNVKDIFQGYITFTDRNPLVKEKFEFNDDLVAPCRPNRLYISSKQKCEKYMLFGNVIFGEQTGEPKLMGSNLYGLLAIL